MQRLKKCKGNKNRKKFRVVQKKHRRKCKEWKNAKITEFAKEAKSSKTAKYAKNVKTARDEEYAFFVKAAKNTKKYKL